MGKKKTFKTYKKDTVKTVAKVVKHSSFILLALVLLSVIFVKNKYFGLVPWNTLNMLGEHELQLNEKEYYYGIDEYIELRYESAAKEVNDLHDSGILTDKYYEYMLSGVNHDYFKNCAILDYEKYQAEADKFIAICDTLKPEDYGEATDECGDDCVFVKYMESYINEAYRENLEESHAGYHKAIAMQKELYQLDDTDWKFYYELDLVSNLDNIEEIEVELTYLPVKTLALGDSVVNWLVRSPNVRNVLDRTTLTLDNKEALNYFNLVLDAAMFDSSIVDKVANVAFMLGNEIEDSTQDDVVIIDISGIEDYKGYIDKKLSEKYKGTNVKDSARYICVSITDRYEGEQVFIIFDVKKCKHKEGLVAFEDNEDTAWKDKAIHNMVVDSFWSEVYSEDVEDVTSNEVQ